MRHEKMFYDIHLTNRFPSGAHILVRRIYIRWSRSSVVMARTANGRLGRKGMIPLDQNSCFLNK